MDKSNKAGIFEIYLNIIITFNILQIVMIYMVSECVCKVIAELLYFADEYFYGFFWNSCCLSEFFQNFSIPIAQFFSYHVEKDLVNKWKLNKSEANFVSFCFIAALVETLLVSKLLVYHYQASLTDIYLWYDNFILTGKAILLRRSKLFTRIALKATSFS